MAHRALPPQPCPVRMTLPKNRLSPIELAKSVAGLRGLTDTKREFEALKASFVPSEHLARVDQILTGLAQEDEFAILCKVMGTCLSICRLSQSPLITNGETPADFLASFTPGVSVQGLSAKQVGLTINCLIEVKSCAKPKFSISTKDLRVRSLFARRFSLPLIFAVRFTMFGRHTLWVLVEANELERRGRRIGCDDLTQSLAPAIFDDYGLYTHPNLHLIHHYDSASAVDGIRHKDYGILQHTTVVLPDCDPIEIPENIATLVNVFFESFEHKLVHVERSDTQAAVVVSVGHQVRILSDLVHSANYLARDESGDIAYDAGRLIARMDLVEKPPVITRDMMEYVASFLNHRKMMLFKMGLGDPDKQKRMLERLARR